MNLYLYCNILKINYLKNKTEKIKKIYFELYMIKKYDFSYFFFKKIKIINCFYS